jgi:hypothetical protein
MPAGCFQGFHKCLTSQHREDGRREGGRDLRDLRDLRD